jgi:ABC-type glycerol-3-phosphate transport system substrate-binding protein
MSSEKNRQNTVSRRDFLRLIALAGGGAALAACGAAPAAPQAPAANEGTTPAPAAAASGFTGTIEFWDWAHDPRIQYMETLIKEWESSHEGVKLKYNPLDWTEIETKILTVASAGTGPAFSNVHYFWRYDLQRAGALAPYPDDTFEWNNLISTPFNRDPSTGQIYTSDFCFYCSQLYYNKELLEAEGIEESEIPRDWDTFMQMAQQLTKKDASGKITQVGLSMKDYWAREWTWQDLIYQAGGWMFNEDGTEAIWNAEEGVRALQFIKDIYHNWQVDDPEFLDQGEAFGNGQAAFYLNQGYTAAGIDSSYPQLAGKWSTTVEPTFTGQPTPAWGMQIPEEGFAVFEKFPADVKALAFDFIKFAQGSSERRQQWALIMGGPPDDIELLEAPEIAENNVIATQAETLPYRVNYGERPIEAEKFWRAMFDEVVLEQTEPKAALDKATEQMNAALKAANKQRIIVERNYKGPST